MNSHWQLRDTAAIFACIVCIVDLFLPQPMGGDLARICEYIHTDIPVYISFLQASGKQSKMASGEYKALVQFNTPCLLSSQSAYSDSFSQEAKLK